MGNYDTAKLIKHLNEKWKGTTCPLCHTANWNISDNIFELRQFSDGTLIIGNVPIVPIIPITCANCGNTVLVNALIDRAIEPPQKEVEK